MAWVAHVVWWRVKLPRRQTKALVLVFSATLLIAAGLWAASGRPFVSLSELPSIAVLYLGAVACYLITYSGVEQTSPSLVIVRAIAAAGEHGCTWEDLATVITEEQCVRPRLEALLREGMLAPVNGGLILTPRGRRAAWFASQLSRAFNIRENS